jgi:hypothetical protein
MTEEEAKTKWCPLVRFYEVEPNSGRPIIINRASDGAIGKESACIGSACMMWRWKTVRQEYPGQDTIVKATPGYYPKVVNTEHGYCGLAEPQFPF